METRGLIGFKNRKNLCYMNSVLQVLGKTKPLLEYIITNEFEGELKDPSKRISILLGRFSDLMVNMWMGDASSLLNQKYMKTAMKIDTNLFDNIEQHDAQEFLSLLVQGLHKDVNQAPGLKQTNKEENQQTSEFVDGQRFWTKYLQEEDSKILEMFCGLQKSVLKCNGCNSSSVSFEPFWELSVPIPLTSTNWWNLTLSDCLNLYMKEEILTGDEMLCDKCGCDQVFTKKLWITKFPRILVIHLKRFTELFTKLKTYINFPIENLDMSRHSDEPNVTANYDLYGVINHHGELNFGHYTAYCKHPYSDEWHFYNDEKVSQKLMGKSLAKGGAYILFYENKENL